jgi:hypothetical protein
MCLAIVEGRDVTPVARVTKATSESGISFSRSLWNQRVTDSPSVITDSVKTR